jgi:YjbE family integral membrane protein
MEWWILAFIKIMFINLILSGDNAIVIAMASKKLPEAQRRLAIFWGTFGAIALRIILTLVAVALLSIPYLTAIGAILLIWLAIKLLVDNQAHTEVKASSGLSNAILTIMVADFVMSVDNVIAITAVAEGNLLLIFVGILFSIPLIIWGSQLIMTLLEKFPVLIYVGAAILAYTAGEMFATEQKVKEWGLLTPFIEYFLPTLLAIAVVFVGWLIKRKMK